MSQSFLAHVQETLHGIEADGLMKRERQIRSPQSGHIAVAGHEVINLCANNDLGLANHPDLIRAARSAISRSCPTSGRACAATTG